MDDYGFGPQMQWYDDRTNPYMQGYEEPANMVEQASAPLPEDFEVYPDFDFSDLKTTNNRPVNSDYLNYIYKKLRKAGYDDKHTAVLLGQIAEESGGDPFAVDSTGTYEGLLQWAPDRYQINTFHDDDPYKEINRQLKYILSTINDLDDGKSWTHGGEGSGYNSRTDAYADWVQEEDMARMNRGLSFGHVRPTGKQASANNRYKVGSQIYDKITTPVDDSVPEMLAQNTYAKGGKLSSRVDPKVIGQTVKQGVLNLLPETVSKGLASIVSFTRGNLAGSPDIKEYYDYGVEEDWNPEEGFLMSFPKQQKYMESIGYHKVNDSNYGMVNKAATRLSSILGQPIPIYQLGEDDIAQEDVDLISTDKSVVGPYIRRVSEERLLRDAGDYPAALYKSKSNDDYYIRAWDLNDYGQHGKSSRGTTYGARQIAAELYDLVGNPFVQRTGLVRVPTEQEIEDHHNPAFKSRESLIEYINRVGKLIGEDGF